MIEWSQYFYSLQVYFFSFFYFPYCLVFFFSLGKGDLLDGTAAPLWIWGVCQGFASQLTIHKQYSMRWFKCQQLQNSDNDKYRIYNLDTPFLILATAYGHVPHSFFFFFFFFCLCTNKVTVEYEISMRQQTTYKERVH